MKHSSSAFYSNPRIRDSGSIPYPRSFLVHVEHEEVGLEASDEIVELAPLGEFVPHNLYPQMEVLLLFLKDNHSIEDFEGKQTLMNLMRSLMLGFSICPR